MLIPKMKFYFMINSEIYLHTINWIWKKDFRVCKKFSFNFKKIAKNRIASNLLILLINLLWRIESKEITPEIVNVSIINIK